MPAKRKKQSPGSAPGHGPPPARTERIPARKTESGERGPVAPGTAGARPADAETHPPELPRPPGLECFLPEGLASIPALEPVDELLRARNRYQFGAAAAQLRVWAVGPGQRLARQGAEAGADGTSAPGLPDPAAGAAGAETDHAAGQPAPGLELVLDSSEYRAVNYGYAGLSHGQLAVLPPIWVAPDGMEVWLVNPPRLPGSHSPSPDDLRAVLTTAGVVAGIDQAAMSAFCDGLARGEPGDLLVCLAQGRPAVPPREARLRFLFDAEARTGVVRPDGSVDFKERNLFPAVEQDALVAECAPPVPGQPGQSVRGKEIPVPVPVLVELIAGDNVRLEEKDGVQRVYATSAGTAGAETSEEETPQGKRQRCTVGVKPLSQIPGDVGYSTGNIDFQGNLLINGSITGGFRVQATGDIAISGSVEAGARVEAGANVVVQQGVFGSTTRVRAGGSVTAKFIHEARIEAGTDVVIGSYVHNAQVQAGGLVKVEGLGGSGGGIVGGRTWAVRGIASRNVGSVQGTPTQLVAGVELQGLAQLEKTKEDLLRADLALGKLLKGIGLAALKAEDVRQLIARNPGQKATLIHYIKKANQMAQVREKQAQELEAFGEHLTQGAREAAVDVLEKAYAKVAVQIGSQRLVLTQDMKRVRFHIDPSGENPGVFWKDLAASRSE